MKVVFHEDFYQVYTSDPAAEKGRIESIIDALSADTEWITPEPATDAEIGLAHAPGHIEYVRRHGLYDIAALAAGVAIKAAETGLTEPCFGLLRPPGHHASADSCWGFCYFNNMAVALKTLRERGAISTAFVLDFDLHHGDGTEDILGGEPWAEIYNPWARDRHEYIRRVGQTLSGVTADMIGISAGFDHHIEDWGGLLATEDYAAMGSMVRDTARRNNGGCFAILEGGYNHDVLGKNVAALIEGMSG